ncbi:hypothetical protein GCM10009839_84610 [Catenulispora yoronensis]|uniref:Uncharacterized protein n=1 Tax=Catenulispora yoronensis TaxID=450799 RepID=A0ABP5H0N4_9ACTN
MTALPGPSPELGFLPDWTCLGVFPVSRERTVATIVREWLREREVEREPSGEDVMVHNLCGHDADGSWSTEARIFVRTSALMALMALMR